MGVRVWITCMERYKDERVSKGGGFLYVGIGRIQQKVRDKEKDACIEID